RYLDSVGAFQPDPEGRRHVTRAVADENGEIHIGGSDECLLVRGTLGASAGELMIDRHANPAPVLDLVRGVRVLVVAEGDIPQHGIPVALQQTYDLGARDERRTTTNVAGLACLMPPFGGVPDTGEPGYRVVVETPLHALVSAPLRPGALPS